MEGREGDRQLATEIVGRRSALAEAVDNLQQIVELLEKHGPSTMNAGLRSLVELGRSALSDDGDIAHAASEMRRRMRSMNRAFTDIVVQSDDATERANLNMQFEAMKSGVFDGLRNASE